MPITSSGSPHTGHHPRKMRQRWTRGFATFTGRYSTSNVLLILLSCIALTGGFFFLHLDSTGMEMVGSRWMRSISLMRRGVIFKGAIPPGLGTCRVSCYMITHTSTFTPLTIPFCDPSSISPAIPNRYPDGCKFLVVLFSMLGGLLFSIACRSASSEFTMSTRNLMLLKKLWGNRTVRSLARSNDGP